MKRNNKLDTFVKHSGDDSTLILLISVGISVLIVELINDLIGFTGNLTVAGGIMLIIIFSYSFIIWSWYYQVIKTVKNCIKPL